MRAAARLSDGDSTDDEDSLHVGCSLAGGRFRVLRELGRGGMGVVYEAHDAERQAKVALKLLTRRAPESVYRLKLEFRSLVDLRHPNLVRLYELFASDERWYYTMEVVAGTDFVSFVRPDGVLSEVRLRHALLQLIAGLGVVHRAGKLHRDLKPANVLITDDSNLVVLDFGLSIDAQRGGIGHTRSEQTICGTLAYMAPEQAAGKELTTASDLYAVGVMLFESLTGRLPFEGTPGELLAAKQRDQAPAARTLDARVSAELDALCASLLALNPVDRPTLEKVAQQLAGGPTTGALAVQAGTPRTLFGRQCELEQLHAAYQRMEQGQAVLLSVTGESGIGKSSLCDAFIEQLRGQKTATILAGRCYERESIPFKLFDPLIDTLTRELRLLPKRDVLALMPEQARALIRLFPALERVWPVTATPVSPSLDLREVQRRALAALTELLHKLRVRRALVLLIDDAQWADEDSLWLLQELLAQAAPAPVLVVLSQRTQSAAQASLQRLLARVEENQAVDVARLQLEPLTPTATATLARSHLPLAVGEDQAAIDRIVRASAGNPFFAIELSQALPGDVSLTVATALRARCRRLSAGALRLLQLLAHAGEPILVRAALQAADATHDELAQLRAEFLVRTATNHGAHGTGQAVECYHDRVREEIAAQLEAEQRLAYDRRLADVLTTLDDVSVDLLRRCLHASGKLEAAARLAIAAAERAVAALAFERAAELYGETLLMLPTDAHQRLDLTVKCAEALELAGRGHEAAQRYLAAAALCSGDMNVDLRRRGALQLAWTGHLAEGTSLLAALCDQLAVPFSRSTSAAVMRLAWTNLRLHLRALNTSAGAPVRAAPSIRLRLEVALAATSAFAGYLPIHWMAAANTYLELALRAGDTEHATRAVLHAAQVHGLVSPHGKLTRSLLARMEADSATPTAQRDLARGYAMLIRGSVAFHRGSCTEARPHLRNARTVLANCHEAGHDVLEEVVQFYDLACASELGAFADIVRDAPDWIDRAYRRGRIFGGTLLSGHVAMPAWLTIDRPDLAHARLEQARRTWKPPPGFRHPDAFLLIAEATIARYTQKHERAFSLIQQGVAQVRQRGTDPGLRTWFIALEGQCAAAVLRRGQTSGHLQRHLRTLVRGAIDHLARSRSPERAPPYGMEIALALALGRSDRAVSLMREAIAKLPRGEQPGAVVGTLQYRLGQLLGGDEGSALCREGLAALAEQGVVDADAMAEMLWPGCHPP